MVNTNLYKDYAQAQTSLKGIVILSSMLMVRLKKDENYGQMDIYFVLRWVVMLQHSFVRFYIKLNYLIKLKTLWNIELNNLDLQELMTFSSEYMTYEG